MMEEIWKDIEGYEGDYQVSNLGRVRSLKSMKPIILKQWTDGKGYKTVVIRKNGVAKGYSVHRLVARAFVEGFVEGLVVNHKDENPSNNKADNLEWCTYSYNIKYNLAHERGCSTHRASAMNRYKRDSDNVVFKESRQIIEQLAKKRVEVGLTQEKLAKMVGISPSQLGNIECWRYNPQFAVVCAIADALGCKMKIVEK